MSLDGGHGVSLRDGCHGVSLLDGGHSFPPLQIGFGFPMDEDGVGFIPLLWEKPHSCSEELENNQKKSGGDHRFEPLDSCSNHESVSIPAPTATATATDLLSQTLLNIAFKLITRKASISVPPEAIICDYLLKSSICSPPPDLIHLEGNNDWGDYAFPGFVSDDDDDDLDDDYDDDYDDDEHYVPCRGVSLVEVFSVVINKNKYMKKKLSLYGTILLDDGRTPEYIYNTRREDSESISLLGGGKTALLLTGLSKPFLSCDTFSIEVDLMVNKGSNLSPDDDDVFCRGRIYWHFLICLVRKYEDGIISSEMRYFPLTSIYDKPLAANFVGRFGSVKVNYVMWLEGVGATVEVTLLNRDGADVYGLIRAGNTCGTFNYWSVLFQKKKSEKSIHVCPGQLIPLSRSIVAVSRRYSLKVSVELYDRLSLDDEIAKGTVDFPAQRSGTSEAKISGRYGGIQVKATWRPW